MNSVLSPLLFFVFSALMISSSLMTLDIIFVVTALTYFSSLDFSPELQSYTSKLTCISNRHLKLNMFKTKFLFFLPTQTYSSLPVLVDVNSILPNDKIKRLFPLHPMPTLQETLFCSSFNIYLKFNHFSISMALGHYRLALGLLQ